MRTLPVVLALLSSTSFAQTILAPNFALGPEKEVAAPAQVPSPAQLDAIVPDPGGFVVFWSQPHDRDGWAVIARRVDTAGKTIAADQQILPAENRTLVSASRRADGTFFLAWRTADGIFLADAGADLVVRDMPLRIDVPLSSPPVTACNAAACAAVWNDSVTTEAAIDTGRGMSVVSLLSSAFTYKLSVATSGNTFGVAYAAIDFGFLAFDATGTVLKTDDYGPAVAYGGITIAGDASGYVVARTTGSGAHVTRKDAQGADASSRDITLPFQPFDMSLTPIASGTVLVASNAVSHGGVDGNVPWIRLYAVNLSPSLDVANAAPAPLDEERHTDINVQTAVSGSRVLAGWTAAGSFMVPGGAFYRTIDPAAFTVDQGTPVATVPAQQRTVAMARSDSELLVLWTENRLDGYSFEAAIDQSGPTVFEPHRYEVAPHAVAASDGRDFAALWMTLAANSPSAESPAANGPSTHFSLISAASRSVTKQFDIPGDLLSNMVWAAGRYLFVTRVGTTVRLNRVAPDGTVSTSDLAETGLFTLAPFGDRLAILSWTGLLSIDDRRQEVFAASGLGALAGHGGEILNAFATRDGRLLVRRVSSDASPLDALPLQLDARASYAWPFVVQAPNGWLVVWPASSGTRAAFVSASTGFSSIPFALPAISAIASSADGSTGILLTPDVKIRELEWLSQPKRRIVR